MEGVVPVQWDRSEDMTADPLRRRGGSTARNGRNDGGSGGHRAGA